MAVEFVVRVWQKRLSEYPLRRRLTPVAGDDSAYDISRAEGLVMQEGDQWSPETMAELERRIARAVSELDTKIDDEADSLDVRVTSVTNLANTKMPYTGGTFTGQVAGQSNTAYTTFQLRNSVMSTGAASGGLSGYLWFRYT